MSLIRDRSSEISDVISWEGFGSKIRKLSRPGPGESNEKTQVSNNRPVSLSSVKKIALARD